MGTDETAEVGLDAAGRAALLHSLWVPTPPELIGKLPRGIGDKSSRRKGSCTECSGYHDLPAIHLDYLGHSDTCKMIARVDPFWTWDPIGGWTDTGEPVFVRNDTGYPTALWIFLTVLGVRRPGVGTVESGKTDPEKELIGDALRNSAMRFGIGADLWSKAKGSLDDGGEGGYDRGGKRTPQRTTRRPSSGHRTPPDESPAAPPDEYPGTLPPPRQLPQGWSTWADCDTAHVAAAELARKLPEDADRTALREHRTAHGWPMAYADLAEFQNLVWQVQAEAAKPRPRGASDTQDGPAGSSVDEPPIQWAPCDVCGSESGKVLANNDILCDNCLSEPF